MMHGLVAPFRIETLVYQFSGPLDRQWLDNRSPEEIWTPACDLSVRRLFGHDRDRCRRFLGFLRGGCFGHFLERRGQWITYGWCTQPGSAIPPHLPHWTGALGAYWIFYCHTREEFRSRGYYKQLLARLISGARERSESALVLCDTLPANFASRSAVLKVGFVPVGVLSAYHLLGPVVIGGDWHPDQGHLPGIM